VLQAICRWSGDIAGYQHSLVKSNSLESLPSVSKYQRRIPLSPGCQANGSSTPATTRSTTSTVVEADFVASATDVAVTVTFPRARGVNTPVDEPIVNIVVEPLDQVTAVFDALLTLVEHTYHGVPFQLVTPRWTTAGQVGVATDTEGGGGGVGVGADPLPLPQPAVPSTTDSRKTPEGTLKVAPPSLVSRAGLLA